MKVLQSHLTKSSAKKERSHRVLLDFIEFYLKSGKPVGSEALRKEGLFDFSSSSLRSYFADLEDQGYLKQQHASGGRTPTNKGFKFYADNYLLVDQLHDQDIRALKKVEKSQKKEVAYFLQSVAEILSEHTGCAVFLSAPRFDQDIVLEIKCVYLDKERFLAVLVTDFGVIQTEVLHAKNPLTEKIVKEVQSYCELRLSISKPSLTLSKEGQELAQESYNELMARYIVSYSTFQEEEVYRCGFSRLLNFKEMQDPLQFTRCLSLFENRNSTRLLLRMCASNKALKYWIGEDLKPYMPAVADCAVVAIPYYVERKAVGAIGIMGPCRLPYKRVFAFLKALSGQMSASLTQSLHKYKIYFREPANKTECIGIHKQYLLDRSIEK